MLTKTKTADSKGRVNLGERFANKTVIIKEMDETEMLVTIARIIPEREAWLYENPVAKAAVMDGLAQAKAGKVADNPPDIAADAELAAELDGDA